jgi:NifU-like protein involved in Fe-S cluster formation/bacterioferritin-associated ferredoxin
MTKSKSKKTKKEIDILSSTPWVYSPKVRKHFLQPKNFMKFGEEEKFKYNALGIIGSPACGDVMKMWLWVDPKTERIKKCRWRTFGCASAIASTSVLSEMVLKNGGMTLEKARKITPDDIIKELGGLPAIKYHCSVLGDKALRDAINDYYRRTKQYDKIEPEGSRVIDKVLKITERDIEKAVIEGAETLEEVQEKTKVGMGDPSCIPLVEELIRFYKEKYNL